MSSSFDEFMREMEIEARQAGPEAEAAFFESQQRHWIGRRLFERRRELGYTQAHLSALSGINQADISKIEHAEANPTVDTLAALATPLGLTLGLEPISEATRALMVRRRPGRAANPAAGRIPAGPSFGTVGAARAATGSRSARVAAGTAKRRRASADGAASLKPRRRAS